ncbi:MAG: hypothetical protein V4487_02690 [Chlamydiota bacterium]
MTDISSIVNRISQNNQDTLDSYNQILLDMAKMRGGASTNQNNKLSSGSGISGSSSVNIVSAADPDKGTDPTVLAIGEMCSLYMNCKQDLALGGSNGSITKEIADYLSKLEALVSKPRLIDPTILADAENMISCLKNQSPLSADASIVSLWEAPSSSTGPTNPYLDATQWMQANNYDPTSAGSNQDGYAICMFLFAGIVNPLSKITMQQTLENILGQQGTGPSAMWLMVNFLGSYNFSTDPRGSTYPLTAILPLASSGTPNYDMFLTEFEAYPGMAPGSPSPWEYWEGLSGFLPN